MNKAEFIRLAPSYYYAAIATSLRGTQGHFTVTLLQTSYIASDGDDTFLEHRDMIDVALDMLTTDGAISRISYPFGDALYKKTDQFGQAIEKLEQDTSGPYYKNQTANDGNIWLRGALRKVNEQYHALDLKPEDFATKLPEEWAPITIDPSVTEIQEAVRQLEKATIVIEQDNGYSASFPQERDQVVQDLKGGLDKLKSEAVSIGWLRRTVNALKTASLRFTNTLKGQMIDGALAAMKDVIKHHIGTALEGLWSYFS